jgi:hypothetical protein
MVCTRAGGASLSRTCGSCSSSALAHELPSGRSSTPSQTASPYQSTSLFERAVGLSQDRATDMSSFPRGGSVAGSRTIITPSSQAGYILRLLGFACQALFYPPRQGSPHDRAFSVVPRIVDITHTHTYVHNYTHT